MSLSGGIYFLWLRFLESCRMWDTAKHSYKLYVSPHNFNGNILYLPAQGYLRVLTQLIIPETKRLNDSYTLLNGMFLI
jgi:hypothetical protein